MKKLIVISLMTVFWLSGCSEKINFVEEGPFVKMIFRSNSEEYYLDHYPGIITVSHDGELRVFTEEVRNLWTDEVEVEIGEDPPTVELQLSENEVKEIKKVITKNDFLSLDENLTDDGVQDGSMTHITVYMEDGEYRVGGANVSDERFRTIYKAIFKHLTDGIYFDWDRDIRKHIYEVNGEPLDE